MTDVTVIYNLTGATLYAETEQAERWLSEELGDAEGLEQAWHVQEEFVDNLLDLARGDGLATVVQS